MAKNDLPTVTKSLKKLEFEKILSDASKEAVSELGRERMLAHRPAYDFSDVKLQLKQTAEAHDYLRLHPQFALGTFKDLRPYLKRALLGLALEPDNFLSVLQATSSGTRVKRTFDAVVNQYPLLLLHIHRIGSFASLNKEIEAKISKEGKIADDATPKLREINKKIGDTKDRTKEKLQNIIHSSSMQKKLQEQIVTIRNERYVVPVKQEYANQVPGLVHDQSSSGATVFIEPMSVVELNNKLKKLLLDKNTEEERILYELTQTVAEFSPDLEELVYALTQLDFIFAKAKYAYRIKATEPQLEQSKEIEIKNARHPLLKPDEVVPIHFWLDKGHTMIVVTGPNTGGKTVALKTIGLLTLMAQAGFFVPADEGSRLAFVDGVFADIGDEQSIEQSLSTFSSHLTNIIAILQNVTEKSLVLLDELGAGTDPVEGAALARALLETLKKRNIITIATTHYGMLKHFAYNTEGVDNASVEFDIATLRPTYRLQMGLPGKSNAFEISRRLGLPEDIIIRAKNLMDTDELEVGALIQSLEEKRRILETEIDQISAEKKAAEELRKSYQDRLEKFKEKEQRLIEEALKDVQEQAKSTKQEMKYLMQQLHGVKEAQEIQGAFKTIENRIDASRRRSPADENDQEPPKSLLPGQQVFIPKLNQRAIVLEIVADQEEALLQAGIMKITLGFKDIRAVEESAAKKERKKAVTTMVSNKSQTISPEIDLRGHHAQEALEKMDKYLDDAMIAGLGQVSIIHGKGTGALAKAIHDYLKNHPQIKGYRYGQHGEGGHGVTIINM